MPKMRGRAKKLYCRRRVAKLLYGVLDSPMTLIIAQPGYGKTFNINSFLSRRKDVGVFRLSIQKEWTAEGALWEHFCEAISIKDGIMADNLRKGGLPKDDLLLRRAISCFRDRLEGMNVLLLDDYENCSLPEFGRFLMALAMERMGQLSIVILSRRMPDFITKGFFYSDACVLMDQDDLRFTRDEIAEYFEGNDCILTEKELDKAYDITCGWPAAVSTLCEDFLQSGFLCCSQSCVKLAWLSCLEQMEAADRLLLTQLSVLDSFTLEQAKYILQNSKIVYQIIRLYEESCFLEFHPASASYTLHPLVRAAALEHVGSVKELERLYYRCAGWYDIHNDKLRALRYYRYTKSEARICDLLSEPYITEIIDQAPMAVHDAMPELSLRGKKKYLLAALADIYMRLVYFNRLDGLNRLEQLRNSFSHTKQNEISVSALGELALLESLAYIDDLEQISRCQTLAAVYFGEARSVLLSKKCAFLFGSPSILWRYHKQPGALPDTIERIGKVFQDFSMFPGGAIPAAERLARAEYAYYRGEFEKAETLSYQTIYLSRPKGQMAVTAAAIFVLARVSVIRGDCECAFAYLSELKRAVENPELSGTILPGAAASASYVLSCMGSLESLSTERTMPLFNGFIFKIVEGRRLIQEGYDIQLEAFAENMICEQNAGVFELLYGYLYLAVSKERLGEKTEADRAVEQAARLAEPDEIILPFVEIAPFLIVAFARSKHPFISALYPRANAFQGVFEAFGTRLSQISLSETEKQIVRWYAGGRKQGEVAKNLNLSVTDTRRAISGIYRKVGVADISQVADMVLR